MKEFGIKEKAKAYDEAIKRAQAKIEEAKVFDYDDEQTAHTIRLTTTDIFPELEESEDERIRKWIIDDIRYNMNNEQLNNSEYKKKAEKAIAWLERQGEQKPVDSTFEIKPKFKVGDTIRELETGNLFYVNSIEDFGYTLHYKNCNAKGCTTDFKYEDNYELVEQKPADKVEHKFEIGDWIVKNDDSPIHIDYICCKITKVENGNYTIESVYGYKGYNTFDTFEKDYHLWTIKDAKDGNVLATSAGAFIYNGNNGGGSCPGSYCGINSLGIFQTGSKHHWTCKKVYPATKEQRDILMKAMADAGYKWDAEKKELKKIGQKLAWSEEDETTKNNINHIIRQYDKISKRENQPCYYVGDCLLWMQNIKERVLPQPKQEWSEEDELMISRFNNCIGHYYADNFITKEQQVIMEDWLKYLKDRVQQQKQEWNEEDAQYLLVCKNALAKYQVSDKWDATIISQWLENKLKSLRPQSTWKPSVEQLEALAEALSLAKNCGEENAFDLRTLLEQLEKLK